MVQPSLIPQITMSVKCSGIENNLHYPGLSMRIQNAICCYLQTCLEELDLFTDIVAPIVSQEHASKDKQRKNSAIIVEEVGNVILSSMRFLHISSSFIFSFSICIMGDLALCCLL